MAHALYAKEVALTTSYAAIESARTEVRCTISAPPTNGANAYVEDADGGDVRLVPGEWHTFDRIDLSLVKVKGTVGDVLTVVGEG